MKAIKAISEKSWSQGEVALIALGAFIAALTLIILFVKFATSDAAETPPPEAKAIPHAATKPVLSHADPDKAKLIHDGTEKLIAQKVLYDVDWDLHVVRIDPLQWDNLDIKTKQEFVRSFYSYYYWQGKDFSWVEIKSSRNDSVFAKMEAGNSPEILR